MALRWPGRRRRWRIEAETLALGVAALGTTGAVVALEVARTWHRGSAPLPAPHGEVLSAARVAVRETGEVARAGYEDTPGPENALLNLLGSFVVSFGLARVSTWSIRRHGSWGPFRNLEVGRRHIHHFVPGILVAFVAGAWAIVSRNDRLDPWLAVPFGAGLGLTLDESALLLRLEDVYWSEEGVLSVQLALLTTAGLASGVLAQRVFRRGEERVLPVTAGAGG